MKKIVYIISLLFVMLMLSSNVLAVSNYVNDKHLMRQSVCYWNNDDLNFGCSRTVEYYNAIEYADDTFKNVQRVGYGYSDNTKGWVIYTLNTPLSGNFVAEFYYNSLGVKGKFEGRSDSFVINFENNYLLYFSYSNYYSPYYNGVFIFKQGKSIIASIKGNVNMWNTYFNRKKWYIWKIGRLGSKYYFELVDYPSNDVLVRLELDLPDYADLKVQSVKISTWQGRLWVDNFGIYGDAFKSVTIGNVEVRSI